MEDRVLDRYGKWTYKYLGTVEASHLQYVFVDLEAANPRHLADGVLDEIIKSHSTSTKLRIYYSAESNDFIFEPVQ